MYKLTEKKFNKITIEPETCESKTNNYILLTIFEELIIVTVAVPFQRRGPVGRGSPAPQ